MKIKVIDENEIFIHYYKNRLKLLQNEYNELKLKKEYPEKYNQGYHEGMKDCIIEIKEKIKDIEYIHCLGE